MPPRSTFGALREAGLLAEDEVLDIANGSCQRNREHVTDFRIDANPEALAVVVDDLAWRSVELVEDLNALGLEIRDQGA